MTVSSAELRTPSHIVGIGASAGGLDAIERFFDCLPSDTSMAFVLVQRLSPDFKSMMDELLARHTQLPIHLVANGMAVEAGHVYLIPPKMEMIISDGRLLLSEQDREQERTLPIDVFFRSLAQDCRDRAVAIVLSGGGTDGSRGILDVHEAGGLVIVQEAATAQFDGMPKTAAESGVADYVAAPQDMPRILADHAVGQAKRTAAPAATEAPTEGHGVGAVYQMLQDEFGIDFTHYKPSTVTRRIERRLALARSQDVDEYVRRLRSERNERRTVAGAARLLRSNDTRTARQGKRRRSPEAGDRDHLIASAERGRPRAGAKSRTVNRPGPASLSGRGPPIRDLFVYLRQGTFEPREVRGYRRCSRDPASRRVLPEPLALTSCWTRWCETPRTAPASRTLIVVMSLRAACSFAFAMRARERSASRVTASTFITNLRTTGGSLMSSVISAVSASSTKSESASRTLFLA